MKINASPFCQAPQCLCPAFDIKAVAFPGTVLHDRHYLDSEDIDGNLLEQYRRSLAFIKRNLRHVQRRENGENGTDLFPQSRFPTK
ncbi:hypothetical protein KV580_23550 [Pseudomonas chlororaphis]|nr:hypothetical protein [Pseudomonas chlororaphis]